MIRTMEGNVRKGRGQNDKNKRITRHETEKGHNVR